MSHHDHHVGDAVPGDGMVPPGGSTDPEPISSAYFVIWGFVLLLAMVLGLQFLGWDAIAAQEARGAGTSSSGPAGDLRAQQEAKIPSIKASMRKVAESAR